MADKTSHLLQAVRDSVRDRVKELLNKSLAELVQLPSHTSEELVIDREKVVFSVWHDVLASQEHRFVVQAYKPGALGIGKMYADGFVVDSHEAKRPLTTEEWAPFS